MGTARLGTTSHHRSRWAAIGAAVAVALGGGTIGIVRAAVTSGERSVFVPITPCRLLDTRSDSPIGPRRSPIGAGESYTQKVHGTNGNCAIPTDAVAVSLNVTAVNGTAASYLTIWPADAERPIASSLNWIAGAPPTPNKVDVDLSADGSIALFNFAGAVDVLADVVGYYADHNHDDRYYTKTDADTRFAPASTRVVHGPLDWVIGPASGDSLNTINGCAFSNFGTIYLPLDLPVGAVLNAVEITVYDSVDPNPYQLQVQRGRIATSGLDHVLSAAVGGGTSVSFASRTVTRRIELPAGTRVEADTVFRVYASGMSFANGNGICLAIAEYTHTP